MNQSPPLPEKAPTLSFALRRPVTVAMLFLTAIVFGWRSYQQLPVNLMPDISYPSLTVRTEYEGAAPEDVEKLVTRPLEEMLAIVSGVVEISSISSPGLSQITLEFNWGTDMNVALQDVRDRLDLFEPPREVTEKPVILRYDPTLDPVIRVALTPSRVALQAGVQTTALEEERALTEIREAAERRLKSDLEAENGIAQVAVKGGREKEIQVLVDSQRLKSLGLSLQDVIRALSQQNINLSGGRLVEGRTEYLVRTLNEFATVEDVANSALVTAGGASLLLRDIAEVRMGEKERETIVRVNGHEAVALDIFKEGDANTVTVCNRVKDILGIPRERTLSEKIAELVSNVTQGNSDRASNNETAADAQDQKTVGASLRRDLPRGTQVTLISDQSRFITAAIQEVQDAIVVGGVLALAILFLFLRELRSTILIGLSIPISVIATFVPMFLRDISLNIMSLGGLALGIGMLVDNSIVVLESMFRCKEEGDDVVTAADRGTKEVRGAVIASTLTTVAVFFPIAFVQGIAGQIFGDLALTVTFSLLSSLFTALLLLPMLATREARLRTQQRDVIWILRCYRIAKEEGGSVSRALILYPRVALRESIEALKAVAARNFGPLQRLLAGYHGLTGILTRIAALLLIPFFLTLFVVDVLFRFLGALVVLVLSIFGGVTYAVFLVVSTIFRVLLWLPLEIFEIGFRSFRAAYQHTLRAALRVGPLVLGVVLLLAIHAGYLATHLGQELIPPMKQGQFAIRLTAPAGTKLSETEARARRIEPLIAEHPDVETVTVEIGREKTNVSSDRGENQAIFTVVLRDPANNVNRQQQIMDELRDRILAVTSDDVSFTLPTMFSFKTAVELQIVSDDLDELQRVGAAALERVAAVPGIHDADLSIKPGYPEVIIELDRALLASKGIMPGEVAERLRQEVQGEVATRFSQGGDKIDIRVKTSQQLLNSLDDLRQLSVTQRHPPVPLEAVAKITKKPGPSEIRRISQRQVAVITANVEGRDLASVSEDIERAVSDIPRDPLCYFVLGGQNRELASSYSSLRLALALAVFLVYVVMACQFESLLQPALVMFSLPLAFVGVIYALYALQVNLSVMVFLGGIILAGIVVNNAIVMVDYTNQLRERGMKKREAVVLSATVRLRPILMTTITTVLGLVPMLTATGEGGEMRFPLALTVITGLTSATLLTLVVIPIVYDLFGGRDRA